MRDTRQKSQRELEAIQSKVEHQDGELRVFIADILPRDFSNREAMGDRMRELENLVTSYGGVVILEHLQKKSIPDYKTYIGGGKLDEIAQEMELQDANLLIIGNALKPHQIYNINEKLKEKGIKAWDRIDLILKIFERNARTTESRLQIELAAIKHMGPRIFNMGMELGKQGGKGSGETNTEIMKRHLSRRELDIKKDLEKYKKVRAVHRESRQRKGFITAGIVGYTNAGKSTLLNALTNKGVLAEDKLFATLGTSVGKMWIENTTTDNTTYTKGTEILLSDTIGFIRDLPPELIDAFASTLEDSIESDVLLHVIDASDPKVEEKIQVVEDILCRIGTTQPKIYVFNKIDQIPKKQLSELKKRHKDKKMIFVSANTGEGFDQIEESMLQFV